MCRRVTCPKCKKADWKGCGAHVEQVLGDVPRAQRCQCRTSGARTPAETGTRSTTGRRRWFRR